MFLSWGANISTREATKFLRSFSLLAAASRTSWWQGAVLVWELESTWQRLVTRQKASTEIPDMLGHWDKVRVIVVVRRAGYWAWHELSSFSNTGKIGTAVVRCQTLRDGAHANTVHPQHGEHLQLRHALVVGTAGHGEDSLVEGGGYPDLSEGSDERKCNTVRPPTLSAASTATSLHLASYRLLTEKNLGPKLSSFGPLKGLSPESPNMLMWSLTNMMSPTL